MLTNNKSTTLLWGLFKRGLEPYLCPTRFLVKSCPELTENKLKLTIEINNIKNQLNYE